jgi:hypothetical protein
MSLDDCDFGLACTLPKDTENEAITIHAGTDHRYPEGASGGHGARRAVPQEWHFGRDLLHFWRKKYGGAWRCRRPSGLKALEDENAKLRKLLAESMMDVSTLRGMLPNPGGEPSPTP